MLMYRYLSMLLLVAVAFGARADFAAPDFAYPKTVIGDAEAVLRSSTAPGEGLKRMKAVMEITVAKGAIARDSMYVMPAFIGSIAARESAQDVRGMMLLYEARTLQSIYEMASWRYNRVEASAMPLPANPDEWSGEQFKSRVKELTDSAITMLRPWMASPVTDYKEVLEIPANSRTFYPLLRDFVYRQAALMADGKDARMYQETVLDMTTLGTPEWALWTAEFLGDKDLDKVYRENPGGVAGGYLLWSLSSRNDNRKECVEMIRKYLAATPSNEMTAALESRLKVLTNPEISASVPTLAVTGKAFDVSCVHSYTGEIIVKVYKETNPASNRYPRAKKLVGTFRKKVDKEAVNDTVAIPVKIDKTGNYLISATCDGARESNSGYASVKVAPWVPLVVTEGNENAVVAASATDGAPMKGINVDMWGPRNAVKKAVGTTGADGFLTFETPKKFCDIVGSRPLQMGNAGGSVYYGYEASVRTFYDDSKREKWTSGNVMVSRPVYHPGDTVGWSVVMVEKTFEPSGVALLKNAPLTVVFRDANYTPVDTVEVTTDSYGRADGYFHIPADRLAGRFTLMVNHGKNTVASAGVMVSDFKAPVFELRDVAVNYADTAYVLTGRAVRYSGVGVPDAEVKAEIGYRWMYARYYLNSGSAELPTVTGKTGADGSFSIVIPMGADAEGCYDCNVTVTSVAADIATATTSFRVGKPYLIVGEPQAIYNTDKPVKLDIYALTTDMKHGSVKATWELCDSDSVSKAVVSGPCAIDSTGITVDWAHVPAGVYTLRIAPQDTTMFKATEPGTVTLYSIARNDISDKTALLLPENTVKTDGNTAEVTVGTGTERYVYTVVFDKDGKPTVKAEKLAKGFHKLKFDLAGKDSQTISFATVADGAMVQQSVTAEREKPARKLTLKGESWRDKVIPGASEEWRIRLTDAKGEGIAAAMVATMYNRSLNALAPLSWPAGLEALLTAPTTDNHSSISYPQRGEDMLWNSGTIRRTVVPDISAPSFLYGGMYGGVYMMNSTTLRIRGSHKMAMSAGAADTLEEAAVEAEAPAAPMPSYAAANKEAVRDLGAAMDEAVAEDSADGGNSAEAETEEFQYRAAEVLQALWMPNLEIGADGTAMLRFTVPNAIGAWTFRANAWTEDCRTAEMIAELTASKPVMVQPSLPRFLRQGDKARVLATVINNTDSAQTVTTRIEIFDAATGAVIASNETTETLGANAQGLAAIDIEAPVDATMIGYRVKSRAGEFSDGEQSLIPVLEASTMAIDSELFYLNDAEPKFSTTIAADPKGKDIVAVQYCQNPVWDAVKALPGLYDFEPKTACSASASAFAALTAKGLLTRFPEIKTVLDIWKSNPQDSALVSKLEKNEDIKLAMLAQTPFVGAANANSAQMQRLAMTFNEKDIERVAKAAIATLGNLQQSDGGFSWGTWTDESSPFITMSVLQTLGRLNAAGNLPDDAKVRGIVSRGLAYLDGVADGIDYGYAYLYSLFPNRKPSTLKGEQSVSSTVQNIVATWKSAQTAAKARQALTLNGLGHQAVAREIMNSVAQFATENGKRGVSFPSVRTVDAYSDMLYAFAKIQPDSKLIDGMRQWLVLQTQATDDLGAWEPTALVGAILSTGARWTSLPTDATANVTIDGKPMEISKVEAATGAFSERLEASPKKRTITFVRPEGGQPAYGSIVTAGVRPLNSIKPRGNDQLSISKRLLVERDGKWVETTEFRLGERVKVQLLVKASRNFEYVTIDDQRPAAFEPVDQMPGWVRTSTLSAYRENGDSDTRLFINWLPKGTYYLTYDMTAAYGGSFVSGTATVQSQYAPELTARSGANTVTVND